MEGEEGEGLKLLLFTLICYSRLLSLSVHFFLLFSLPPSLSSITLSHPFLFPSSFLFSLLPRAPSFSFLSPSPSVALSPSHPSPLSFSSCSRSSSISPFLFFPFSLLSYLPSSYPQISSLFHPFPSLLPVSYTPPLSLLLLSLLAIRWKHKETEKHAQPP